MNPRFFYFISSVILGATSFGLTGCPGESTKKAVSTVTEKTVENVKGAVAGISEGFDEGRKQVTGADGAIVLTSLTDMEGKITAEILKVEQSPDNTVISVSVGFANNTEQPYRITKIFSADTVMLLDKDGYVARLTNYPSDVTVPAKAKDKTTLQFQGSLENFVKIRIFGKDYPLPSANTDKPAEPVKLSTSKTAPEA